jgi:arsenate reductase (thioredoxin)
MPSSDVVVFVCLHGSAKSVIASAYLNRLSAERGLHIRATAAGVDPDPNIPIHVQNDLLQDDIDVRDQLPRRVNREELSAAWHVVSFACDLEDVAPAGLAVEQWDDIPAVSDGFPAARDAILGHVRRFLDRLAADQVPKTEPAG